MLTDKSVDKILRNLQADDREGYFEGGWTQSARLEEDIREVLEHTGEESELLECADDFDSNHSSPGTIPIDLEPRQALVVLYEVRHSKGEDGLV